MPDSVKITKLDFEIVSFFDERIFQPDGSVLFLRHEIEGENAATIRPGYGGQGSYIVEFEHTRKRLHSFVSIKRKSTNNYFLIVCEVGVRTLGGNFQSMTEINAYLRENFFSQLVHGLTKKVGRV